jgi:hypothetical protein
MARPKKEKTERRTQVWKCNLTPAEDLSVAMNAAAAGISRAEYQRRRLLGQSVTPPPARADAAVIAELQRHGNNLNQIARDVNSGREYRGDWEAVRSGALDLYKTVLRHYDS